MGFDGFEMFRAKCQGIGYWTHFFCGAIVAILQLKSYNMLANAVAFLLIAYQLTDYMYGIEDMYVTNEFGLFRDLIEYLIGYIFVICGAYLERKRRKESSNHNNEMKVSSSTSLSPIAVTTIVFGSMTFELSRVTIQVILPIIFKYALGLSRDQKTTLQSLNFFGAFLGMFAAAPLTGLLGSQKLTSLSLLMLGLLVILLSSDFGSIAFLNLEIIVFVMGTILSIVSVGLNTTVQIVSSGKNRTSANLLYRASGLLSVIIGPQITWLMENSNTSSDDADHNTKLSMAYLVLHILAGFEILGAIVLFYCNYVVTKANVKIIENLDKKTAKKKNLSFRKIANIFVTIYAYQPLFYFCVVLSCIASIEPVMKGFLPDYVGGSPSFQSSMHSLAATVSLLLVGTQFLKGKDCRSALFTFSCLHSTGMIGLSFFKHPIGKASSYILVKVVTDLAKIPTGIWTTKCAEGYMKHKNETTKNNNLTVAIIVASGLGMQKLLGSLLKAFISAGVRAAGEDNISLDHVFIFLMCGALTATYFIGKLPNYMM